MNKTVLAAPLMAVFLAGCSKNINDATCYVNVTDPENITATIKSDITDGVILEGAEFKYNGNDMKTEDIEHNFSTVISSLSISFSNQTCKVYQTLDTNYIYPMELIGGKFPEPAIAPQ